MLLLHGILNLLQCLVLSQVRLPEPSDVLSSEGHALKLRGATDEGCHLGPYACLGSYLTNWTEPQHWRQRKGTVWNREYWGDTDVYRTPRYLS